MKQRILSNWTFTRAMFLVMGILVIIQSAMIFQWFGVAFGAYFASMGLFAFGCAAGNCATEPLLKSNTTIEDVEFEEVKTK
jgi:Flp pilus assembly protein protease CpaA